MSEEVLAWYFAQPDERLAYDDGREVAVGVVHEVEGQPELCKRGLHGSVRALDALQYAHSSILYRVKISGNLDEDEDKLCGQRREYLARYDVEDVLRVFARKQALINIEKIEQYCSSEDYALIINWLETGDEELRSAAGSAAASVARSATRSAARYAAESVAWSAAESAARYVARYVAWYAAESVALSAAQSAAWSAESAARSAARCRLESTANEMLTKMIEEKFQ